VKRKRFSVEQITSILKQVELGTPIAELCRIHGVSEQSYYRWKKIWWDEQHGSRPRATDSIDTLTSTFVVAPAELL
jgi:transposase-like protein